MPALAVNEADEDYFSDLILQVNDDGPQCFVFVAGGFVDDLLRVGANEFDPCRRPRSARDEETRPRLRDLERDGRQRAFRIVAELFESADPVIALVIAPHVIAARENGIAFDRLAFECFAFRFPIAQVAGFKVEIERLAVFSDGFGARRGCQCDGDNERGNTNRSESETRPEHKNLVAVPCGAVKTDNIRHVVSSDAWP